MTLHFDFDGTTLQGDSRGPLTLKKNRQHGLIGVTGVNVQLCQLIFMSLFMLITLTNAHSFLVNNNVQGSVVSVVSFVV